MTRNIFGKITPEQDWILGDAEAQKVVIKTLELFQNRLGEIAETFRRSYDKVYMESGRFEYGELKNTEKCNLGSVFQDEFLKTLELENRKKGRDTLIANVEVDVKWTSSSFKKMSMPTGWRVPPECSRSILLLASSNDYAASWSIGIVRCDPEALSKSENRDKKRTLNGLGKKRIVWLLMQRTMTENKFLGLDPYQRRKFSEDVGKIKKSKEEEYRKLINSYEGGKR